MERAHTYPSYPSYASLDGYPFACAWKWKSRIAGPANVFAVAAVVPLLVTTAYTVPISPFGIVTSPLELIGTMVWLSPE